MIKLNLTILIITGLFSFFSCKQGGNDNSIVVFQGNKSAVNKEDKTPINHVVENKREESVIVNHDSVRCNINFIVKLKNTMENPSENDVLNFLYTFDESCSASVEFLEFSNEILFQILFEHPDVVLKLLSHGNVKTNLILEVLKSPVNDKYDIKDIIKRIDETKENEMKNKVKKSLRNE